MGNHYIHLRLSERVELYHLHAAGATLRDIARKLGRSVSTVSRELRRNGALTKHWPGGYRPERAHSLALRRRRWDCRYKLARQPALQQQVREFLVMGYSPEQIAGRLARLHHRTCISHESIYRFIYHRSAQKDYWHRLLPRARFRRGRHSRRKSYALQHLKERLSIHDRPAEYQDRTQHGHWEADLMLFSTYGQAVLVAYERRSRMVIAAMQGKSATETYHNLHAILRSLPACCRQSIVFDNGTEFAQHHLLKKQLDMQTFFCDVRAPWQKGGVENAIGRLRRFLPRNTNLSDITTTEFTSMIQNYNNTPRKCLGYQTPTEVWCQNNKPLHFKRESTFPPSRE